MTDLDQLRARAIAQLQREGQAVSTGMLAVLLRVPAHQLILALDTALQRREVVFDGRGWNLPAPEHRPTFDDQQGRIDG